MPTKIIVTHEGRLKKKYGSRWKDVERGVKRLIAADAGRGVTTFFVPLDAARPMGNWRAKASDSRSFKDAIDHAYLLHDRPDYVAILGGPDVVPHQVLRNPLTGRDRDDDPEVPSDLPYACDAAADDRVEAFVGPSRVVGRIPDMPGATADAGFLVSILDNAAGWKAPAKKGTPAFFGLSAQVWRTSTTMSLRAMFGASAATRTSPLDGPAWTKKDLNPAWHFINCHGAPADPRFFGQRGQRYPVAEDAATLPSLIRRGTIAAAECCYGAEIYDPSLATGPGICLTYLQEGAIAFMGSTTIAYGPADRNESADLLCRFFMQTCLTGASTGRALLQARQTFARDVAPISPVDLKTLAQFLLLGDPSLRGVAVPEPKTARTRKAKGATAAPPAAHVITRGALTSAGTVLAQGTDTAAAEPAGPTPPHIEQQLAGEAVAAGYVPADHAEAFAVQRAGNAMARSALTTKAFQQSRFHVLQADAPTQEPSSSPEGATPKARGGRRASAAVPKRMLLVGHEVAGRVVRVQRLYAHVAAGDHD